METVFFFITVCAMHTPACADRSAPIPPQMTLAQCEAEAEEAVIILVPQLSAQGLNIVGFGCYSQPNA